MTATNQNFSMWQGDAKSLQITTTNDAGAPYDLSNVEAIVWAMGISSVSAPLVEKTLTSGISVNDPPTAGIFTVSLASTDTTGLAGSFYHEARITDSGGNPRVVTTGNITINNSNL